MTKVLVVAPDGPESNAPFLRGILTHSLQDAGLTFDDAYAVASSIRDDLSEAGEVTKEDLRKIVIERLLDDFGEDVAQRYRSPQPATGTILVRDADENLTAFSREQQRRHLESSGLSYEDSMTITQRVYQHLLRREIGEISAGRLGLLIYRLLKRRRGVKAATRYLLLSDHLLARRPLLLLIGGAPGSGKSAIATKLAHRLEIDRTQSTDMLREVMRMMLPERLLPVLHASSFSAWWALPGKNESGYGPDTMLAAGFQAQTELVSVPCEAVVRRSLTENTSLILEGVHVEPTLLAKLPKPGDAVIVPIMLAVLSQSQLRARLARRGEQCDQRSADRYLDNFEAIWNLQGYLLSEADRWNWPIVRNHEPGQALQDCMKTILDHMALDFDRAPREVFAQAA